MIDSRSPAVTAVFDAYPPPVRSKMLALRDLILRTAAGLEEVGPIEETLKWNEPAYLTSDTGSGSTIRIDWKSRMPDRLAMYFSCQTTLIDEFRQHFGGELRFDGNRAIVFDVNEALPMATLVHCIESALTYHLRRKRPTIR